ncbi:hypothetical protein PVL29_012979 [Vitis rotundifolia]|uniref:Glutamate receptor n=1 Tax=Vitis rotundifolia TaxID=103349 RepID=A0AA39DP49_VITRO|nr:hypothetical protein PVL29_012979 [Vitis rotundifolia]
MPFPLNSPTPCFIYFSLTSILLIVSHLGHIIGTAADDNSTIIGAIIDANSRKGKEEITAIKIAVEKFNNNSKNRKLSLVFRNFTGELYQAALTAEELIKENKVQVIVGMDTWQQAALAAEIGNQAQVPVLSLAASASVRPSRQLGRPTLLQMGSNVSEKIRCISAIVHSYHWRRVIAIYEDDAFDGNAEMLTLLSEALQRVGSEIEYHLSLPPISSLSDPRGAVHQELLKLLSTQSRVFIVLRSSLPMATHLFQEARRMDFMGKDSAWIITDSISSFLDSMDTSVIPYMEGALGIKSYYSKSNRPFLEFSAQFQKKFKSEYPEEDNAQPGIHALRAYDSIAVITRALERLASDDTNTPNIEGEDKNRSRNTTKVLDGPVIWPGYLKRVPKGWEMPTDAKPLKIGIPANSSFDMFVKVNDAEAEADKRFTGFSIDIFLRVLKILEQNYSLPYDHRLTGALLIYTMFIVWVLEYQSNNPAFRGPWKSQLGTALWFTFSSLFFAHSNNITRIVIVVWLFVVFVLTSSYTASLSSMLTARRFEPNVTDVEWLKATKSVVGCDGDSFLRKYLENEIKFTAADIKNISNQYQYPGEFQSGNISAAFLELPHAKVFTNQFCKNYTATQPLNRFGGFAFCSTTETDELSLGNFWALYLLCGATSTLCFLLFFLRLLIDFKRHQASRSDANPNDESVWMKTVQLVHFFHSGQTEIPNERQSNLSPRPTGDECSTPWWSPVSPSEAPEPPEASAPTATMNSRVAPSDAPEPPETPPPTATMYAR